MAKTVYMRLYYVPQPHTSYKHTTKRPKNYTFTARAWNAPPITLGCVVTKEYTWWSCWKSDGEWRSCEQSSRRAAKMGIQFVLDRVCSWPDILETVEQNIGRRTMNLGTVFLCIFSQFLPRRSVSTLFRYECDTVATLIAATWIVRISIFISEYFRNQRSDNIFKSGFFIRNAVAGECAFRSLYSSTFRVSVGMILHHKFL